MPPHSRQLVYDLGHTSDSSESSRTNMISVHPKGWASTNRALKVAFRRTVRVSDNNALNDLPPDMGSFPLYEVSCYEDTLPSTMTKKGGYFLPMHQREAMWIRFTSQEKFAVKIYVGGVNAVSGEPSVETEQTQSRRYKLMSEKKNIQDYVVTPQQLWLDGIASTDGTVRQFVAMPLGSGYSVEAQVSGLDLVGGLQIEVTPSRAPPHVPYTPSFTKPAGTPYFDITVKTLLRKEITFKVSGLHAVHELKELIEGREGIPLSDQRLIFKGKQLEDGRTLSYCQVGPGSVCGLVLALRGGGDPEMMGIAAGGLIKQTIRRDNNDPIIWDPNHGTIFNVQILNSAVFKAVTGECPPTSPVTAKTYAEYGYPYYSLYDEKPSGIKGDFAGVKSVAEKDLESSPTAEKAKAVAEVIEDTNNSVVVLDSTGRYSGFRPVKTMEKELVAKFGQLDLLH